jgi:hypothetical protein
MGTRKRALSAEAAAELAHLAHENDPAANGRHRHGSHLDSDLECKARWSLLTEPQLVPGLAVTLIEKSAAAKLRR